VSNAQAPPNGRLMNFSVGRELCAALWSHSHGTSLPYYTANILGRVDGQAAESHGRYWMYVARVQSVVLLFNECQYRQWRPGPKVFNWDRNLLSTILFVFMAVNWICDPCRSGCRIAIHDTQSENRNITKIEWRRLRWHWSDQSFDFARLGSLSVVTGGNSD